jgi:hypothetical protein
MADSTGEFGQSFMGGVLLVIDSDDQGTNDFSLPFMGGVLLCIEQDSGGPGPSGEGGLFFAHG